MYGFLPPALSGDSAAPLSLADGVEPDEGQGQLPLSFDAIDSLDQFAAISEVANDLVKNGRVGKFLVDRRTPSTPGVYFLNTQYMVEGEVPEYARLHWPFARRLLQIPESNEEFNAATYFTEDKRYFAGVLHTYYVDGSTEPILGLQAYPQDVIRESVVVESLRPVIEKIDIPGIRLAFVPTGSQQTVATVTQELTELGLEVLTLDRILGAIQYLPLNVGEAWGHLRIFPSDPDDLRPTDIPVFDELPLDLSVVAGVLTRAVQDSNSHVNLKSKERRTPNAVLRNAARDNPQLAPYADQPTHMVIAKDALTLEATTEETIASKLAERLDRPLIPLTWEPEDELRSYDEMAQGTTATTRAFRFRYGSKAANLAFLARRDVLGRASDPDSPSGRLGYDLVPQGFAVPLQAYRDFVDHSANVEVRERIDRLVAAEQAGQLSPKQRAEQIQGLQDAFMRAPFPPGALERIRAKLDETLPGASKVKVRSSANAEDVPDFDGAGLHDSFAADTGKEDRPSQPCLLETASSGAETKRSVKPKSLGCAVKGVYASLWNKRAVEERTFARIDQSTVAMGLSIVPAYDTDSEVAANAVVVTRVLNAEGIYGYSLSVQEGNNLVTNPDPGTFSETTIAAFIAGDEPTSTSLTVTRFAKPAPGLPQRTEPVLPRDKMIEIVELAKLIERAYCRAEPDYYPADYPRCEWVLSATDKETSLDLEIKLLDNDHLVYKQVREFAGL